LAISRQRKEELVAEYADMLNRSSGVILTDFRGMNDHALKAVRKAVVEANGTYRITKTTILKRALESSGYPFPPELKGSPIAVGFCFGEVPAVAKALINTEILVIRGGMMGHNFISPDEVKAIAELPPIEVLRAQLLGLLDAPAASLVGVIQSGVGQVINVINTYAEKEGAAAA
jgi:large subunit ribosomal protein L10